MKINIKCDRVFARDRQIAILKNNKLDIFEQTKLLKSLNVVKSANIKDFLLNFETDLNRIEDLTNIFIIKDKEMIVDKNKIIFNCTEHSNEIHEPGCIYFTAWADKIVILGNNKSFNFIIL